MKRLKNKISEVPLKCDNAECKWERINHDDDIIIIAYSRGNTIEAFSNLGRMNDLVEVYHVDCAPQILKDRMVED